jgi:hypothetical protein
VLSQGAQEGRRSEFRDATNFTIREPFAQYFVTPRSVGDVDVEALLAIDPDRAGT